jgi:hypothetical protein
VDSTGPGSISHCSLITNHQACQALYGFISCLIVGVRPSALGTFQRAAAGTKHSGTAVLHCLKPLGWAREQDKLSYLTAIAAPIIRTHNRFSPTRGTFPDPELACHDDVAGSTQCKGHTPGERRLPVPKPETSSSTMIPYGSIPGLAGVGKSLPELLEGKAILAQQSGRRPRRRSISQRTLHWW